MSAILREDPPELSMTNQSMTPGLERIVRHCLEKSPDQRFHSAHDLAFDIEALSGTSATMAAAVPSRRRLRLVPAALLALGALVGAGAAYLATRGTRSGGAGGPRRGHVPPAHEPVGRRGLARHLARRPDGRLRAPLRSEKTDIWIQRAGGRNPIDLTPDCDGDSYFPAFSPDGNLIAYGAQCGEGGLS